MTAAPGLTPIVPLRARRRRDRGTDASPRAERTADLFDRARHSGARRRRGLLGEVVLLNRGVAEAVARRFHGRDVDPEDLQQVAYEALVKAAQRFDPGRNHDFLAFAVPTIRGELQRYFRDLGWMVRPTRSVQETQWRVARAEEWLAQDLGRTPTRGEVLDLLDLSGEEYDAAMSVSGCFRPTSLDRPASAASDSASMGDLIADVADELEASEARVILAPVVRQLSERDQRVLYLRFCEGRTQNEIGLDIGVTQTQVSRILAQILAQLHDQLTSGPEPRPAA